MLIKRKQDPKRSMEIYNKKTYEIALKQLENDILPCPKGQGILNKYGKEN